MLVFVYFRPVLIEVPHFASLRDKEREIQIMRSDNGETWYEHPILATEDAVATAMAGTFEGEHNTINHRGPHLLLFNNSY